MLHTSIKSWKLCKINENTYINEGADNDEDFIQEFASKYNSACDMWMDDSKSKKLFNLSKTGRYAFKCVSFTEDDNAFKKQDEKFEVYVNDQIEKYKGKGWKVFAKDRDNGEVIFYKEKAVKGSLTNENKFNKEADDIITEITNIIIEELNEQIQSIAANTTEHNLIYKTVIDKLKKSIPENDDFFDDFYS